MVSASRAREGGLIGEGKFCYGQKWRRGTILESRTRRRRQDFPIYSTAVRCPRTPKDGSDNRPYVWIVTSQGVMRTGNPGLNSHGGKNQNNPTWPLSGECKCAAAVLCRLLEAAQANAADPSS